MPSVGAPPSILYKRSSTHDCRVRHRHRTWTLNASKAQAQEEVLYPTIDKVTRDHHDVGI